MTRDQYLDQLFSDVDMRAYFDREWRVFKRLERLRRFRKKEEALDPDCARILYDNLWELYGDGA